MFSDSCPESSQFLVIEFGALRCPSVTYLTQQPGLAVGNCTIKKLHDSVFFGLIETLVLFCNADINLIFNQAMCCDAL